MSNWFVRSGGNNLNSGGGYTDAADIVDDSGTGFVIAGGTGLTFAAGGLSSLPADSASYTRSVNLQIGGVSTIRKITVLTDTTATLSAAVADGSYNGRIGGARATVQLVVNTGSGQNAALAATDSVSLEPLPTVFTENTVTCLPGVTLRGKDAMAKIDGTGGGAGSDVLSHNGFTLDQVTVVNGVDRGITRTGSSGGVISRSKILNCGGAGISMSGGNLWYVEIGSCSLGMVESFPTIAYMYVHDITTVGVFTTQPAASFTSIRHSIFANNGDHGLALATNNARTYQVEHCLFIGNTKSGISYAANYPAVGPHISNCSFVGNTRYGIESAALTLNVEFWFGHNLHFHDNDLGKYLNFPEFQGEITGDPLFVDQGSADYTLQATSPLVGAGYTEFESPMLVNIGPTVVEASGGGGTGQARASGIWGIR